MSQQSQPLNSSTYPAIPITSLLPQGDKGVNQQKICQMSLLNQLFPSSSCRGDCRTTSGLIREKFSTELSSGIATGSSGVTPREPNSWQHIADFLKRRQKHTGNAIQFDLVQNVYTSLVKLYYRNRGP